MFSLNLPIFEEGIIHNNVREAYSRLRQAVSRAKQADNQVNEDVRVAVAEYQASMQRVQDLSQKPMHPAEPTMPPLTPSPPAPQPTWTCSPRKTPSFPASFVSTQKPSTASSRT